MKWLLIATWISQPGVTVKQELTVSDPVECARVAMSWQRDLAEKGHSLQNFHCMAL